MSQAMQTQVKAPPAIKPIAPTTQSGLLQRQCACGGNPGVDGECAECRAKRLSMQRQATTPAASTTHTVPPIVHEVLSSQGRSLDAGTRAFMEPRFGHDFSTVRVHTDAKAAESARAVNALAYTVGRDVVFGAGQYSPGTSEGKRLMAHELTHVVQQDNQPAVLSTNLNTSPSDDPFEWEANHMAEAVENNSASGTGQYHMLTSTETALLQREKNQPDQPSLLHPCTDLSKIQSAVGIAEQLVSKAISGLQELMGIWGKAPSTPTQFSSNLALARGFNIAFDKTGWVSLLGIDAAEVKTQDSRDRAAVKTILENFQQVQPDLPHYLNAPPCQIQMTLGLPCVGCVAAEHARCKESREEIHKVFVPPAFMGYPSSAILFCPAFFNGSSDFERAVILVHEITHLQAFAAHDKINNVRYYGCPVEPIDEGPGLRDPLQFIGIADSYACFLRTQEESIGFFKKVEQISQEAKQVTKGIPEIKKPHLQKKPSASHTGSSTVLPEWLTSSVKRTDSEKDAKFPWQLRVDSLPCKCDELRWEQFMSGGFTIYDIQRKPRTYEICETLRKAHLKPRQYGSWCDDIPEDDPRSGPHPVGAYYDAHCDGSTYIFNDAPGFRNNFGDEINKMKFIGISWGAKLEHKLWRAGQKAPFHIQRFDLVGQYWDDGPDTREIK